MKLIFAAIFCFLAMNSHAVVNNGARSNMLEFPGGHLFAITQLCIDKGYLRPFHPLRSVCSTDDSISVYLCPSEDLETTLLKLPITQIKRYDLGFSRYITRVDRIQTQNISMNRPYGSFAASARQFSVPNCPNSMIPSPPELTREVTPTAQERIIYTALFQRGITLIRQSTSSYQPGITGLLAQVDRHSFSLRVQAPQCQAGTIEFSEEFINYLRLPEAIDFLFNEVDLNLHGGEGSGAGAAHPELNLLLIGGEGSGAGRIVMGGEGSGAGRALEGRHFDPMDINSGEIQIDINMQWNQFNSNQLDETEIEYLIEQLNEGLQVPSDQVGVQCQ
jgi:hypothetical protein